MLHGTSRTAKIAGVAALAGLMMTVAIVAVVQPDESAPPPRALPAVEGQARLVRELDRCSTLTMPDTGCEATWAANRRRFFRQEEPASQTESETPESESAEP